MEYAFRARNQNETDASAGKAESASGARCIQNILPTRLSGEWCLRVSSLGCVRPSLTAEVKANVQTVAHRNGTPPASGTQS